MKTRLNIISLLILLVFGIHIGYAVYRGFENANKSMKKYDENSSVEQRSSSLVTLNTHNPIVIDSIFNEKTGSWLPVQTEKVAVPVPIARYDNLLNIWSDCVFVFVVLFGLPTLLICFYKVIRSVNAVVIFDKKNISRLRIIGLTFLALWVAVNMRNLVMSWDLFTLLANTTYSLERGGLSNLSFLIYGLISFLSAEVLAIGLRLKEEQDLTI